MPSLYKALAGLALAVVLLLGGLTLRAQHTTIQTQRDELGALTTQVQALGAKVQTIQALAHKADTDAQTARMELKHALDQTPAAAAAPVPGAVVDSLCKRLRCSKPNPLPAPAG